MDEGASANGTFRAERANEHVKAVYSLTNTVARRPSSSRLSSHWRSERWTSTLSLLVGVAFVMGGAIGLLEILRRVER